jgi:hypothetical protein
MQIMSHSFNMSSSDEDEEDDLHELAERRAQVRRRRLMLLYVLQEQQQRSRSFVNLLENEERRMRERRIPRNSLVDPSDSPWLRVLNNGSEQAMITLTGFSHSSFHQLHSIFRPIFVSNTPYSDDGTIQPIRPETMFRQGRPRMCTSHACLGLVLVYGRTTGSMFLLSSLFGLTMSPLQTWLRFGRRILYYLLKKHPLARVKMPAKEKVHEYMSVIGSKYPHLKKVYCVADGLKIAIEAAGDGIVQEMFYNGWTQGHFITNVFVFAPDGTIISCILNCPGCMHDSELAGMGRIYGKLEEVYRETGGKCVMDSAFCARGNDFVIKSVQNLHDADGPRQYSILRQATSMRQAAEWGMRALQGSFPRLKATLKYEELGERKLILSVIVLLYNWRANTVGLNQIRSVFMRHLDCDCTAYVESLTS